MLASYDFSLSGSASATLANCGFSPSGLGSEEEGGEGTLPGLDGGFKRVPSSMGTFPCPSEAPLLMLIESVSAITILLLVPGFPVIQREVLSFGSSSRTGL